VDACGKVVLLDGVALTLREFAGQLLYPVKTAGKIVDFVDVRRTSYGCREYLSLPPHLELSQLLNFGNRA